MKKSETIVANWTYDLGNESYASFRGNASDIARCDCTGRLASDQATALSKCCSIVRSALREYSCRCFKRAEPFLRGRRQYQWTSSDMCILWALRCTGSSMITRCDRQSREGTSSISVRGGMRKPTPSDIWDGAPADEGVVPMMLPITREKREGPLGSGGSLEERTQDIAGNGYSSASEGSELTSTCMCAPNSGFEAYLKPKGKGICEMPHLKPERGNLAFRNFRGLSRNGLLGFPLMDVNSIIKQFKVEPRRTALLFYSVEAAWLQSLVGKAGKDLGHRKPTWECGSQPRGLFKAWRMR